MKHETFIKLASGTREDFMIACYWLAEHHDPIKYIEEHGNMKVNSPNCTKSISWNEEWDGNYTKNNLYYKYEDNKYLIRCNNGITVTDRNYDPRAEVIIH